jgi:hypothetical protein
MFRAYAGGPVNRVIEQFDDKKYPSSGCCCNIRSDGSGSLWF